MKIVTVTIDEKGDADVVLEGFAGKGCAAITEGFVKAHGKSVSGVQHTADYNKPCLTKTKLQQKG